MLKKLPKADAILAVFAVISAMTYGWTLLAFLWKLPSWLHYLTPGEILSVYSYSLLTDFSESTLYLALLLLLCVLLPARILSEAFVRRGTALSLCALGGMMANLGFYINNEAGLIGPLPAWLVIAVGAITLMVLLDTLSGKYPLFAYALIGLADRLTIFLYLNLPLTAIALVVVAVRNLL